MKKGIILVLALTVVISVGAGQRDNDKGSKTAATTVDSGTFGIFINGKRVGTEKFRIDQSPQVGIITSEIKVDQGEVRADQTSEMQIAPNGELRVYRWHSNTPSKEESVVEPKDEFLVEHLTAPDQRKHDVPYILPLSTVILDDNFFIHRELLAWRYLATGCLPTKDHAGLICDKVSHFGVLVPHQHAPGNVEVQLMGRDKIAVKGVQVELNKLRLNADGVEWFLWMDDPENHYKVIKMAIASSNVEVVRD